MKKSRLVFLMGLLLFSPVILVPSTSAKKACSISLELLPQTVTVGESVKVSVTLRDASIGAGLDRQFRLHYSKDGGNSWNALGLGIMGRDALQTDEEGKFSDYWRPSEHLPHDYIFKAYWEGDEVYEKCTVIKRLTVNLPDLVPLAIEDVRSTISGNKHYIVGWIRNTGDENLRYVKVAVGYYNSSGNSIYTSTLSVAMNVLTPGQSSPFMFSQSSVTEIAKYEVVVSKFVVTDQEPYLDFQFSKHRSVVKVGNPQVVGLVQNIGSMNAESVKVIAIFYDASDNLLGYGTSSAMRSILTKGESSPFDVSGSTMGELHHYALVVEAQGTLEQPGTDLQIIEHIGRLTDTSYHVTVEIENMGQFCADDIKVIGAFYDTDENIVDCTTNYGIVSTIIPGQSRTFEIYARVDVSNIDHYELWVDYGEKVYLLDVRARAAKIYITSNSSYVSSISFDYQARAITFNTMEQPEVRWCQITVPKIVLGGPFTVFVDDEPIAHKQTENSTHAFITFTLQPRARATLQTISVEIIGATFVQIEESWISCSIHPESVEYGAVITTISGNITPMVAETKSVPVTIQSSQDGLTWTDIDFVISTSDGSYTYRWVESLDIETYYIRAMWSGSETYMNATSEVTPLIVTKAETIISVSLSKTTIAEGDSLTVSGAIIPESSITVLGNIMPEVSDKTVTLNYRKPDGMILTRTTTSSSDGSYSDSYEPEATGSWRVVVSWDGDSTYVGATSETIIFTVEESSGGGIPGFPYESIILGFVFIGFILWILQQKK